MNNKQNLPWYSILGILIIIIAAILIVIQIVTGTIAFLSDGGVAWLIVLICVICIGALIKNILER